MRASNFEYQKRFWIMLALYSAAFACWPLDRKDVAGFLNRLLPQPHPGFGFLFAAVTALLGACLVTWSSAYLPSNRPAPSRLVTAGPYGHLRNPEYLATILCFIAFALLLNRLGFLLATAGITLFVSRLVRREEAQLSALFGLAYQDYCENVPRLLPALHPRFTAEMPKPNWRAGLLGSAHLWIATAALVTLSATLNGSLFFAVLAAALVTRVLPARPSKPSGMAPTILGG